MADERGREGGREGGREAGREGGRVAGWLADLVQVPAAGSKRQKSPKYVKPARTQAVSAPLSSTRPISVYPYLIYMIRPCRNGLRLACRLSACLSVSAAFVSRELAPESPALCEG